jgi:serine/threonine-protein kinase
MGFATGENVGPYRIIAQLGSGGMATVYKAYHAALDRYVAIKVMHAAFKEDSTFLARFQREARIVAKLEHPHIVPIYDFNEHEGQPYLVMRFIEGETLKARLQRGPLTISQIMDILRPVCQALGYAHEQGVLHRDIKPSNVLLTPQGGVFLADFGLARIAQAGESTLSQDTMLGTPHYISPEQAQGQPHLDARTDIYSLGVVMYELLVGRVPFQADTPYAVIHDHIYSPLPMPRCLNPTIPEPYERVLLRSLAKERDDRFTTASDLLAALDKAAAEAASAPPVEVKSAPGGDQFAPTVVETGRCESPAERADRSSPMSAATVVAAPVARVEQPAVPSPFTPISPAAPAVQPVPSAPSAPQTKKKPRSKLWYALGGVALLVLCVVGFLFLTGLRGRTELQRARQSRDQDKFEQALAQYQAAAKANARLVQAYTEPAEMLLRRDQPGDVQRAAEICQQGLAVMPNNPDLRACTERSVQPLPGGPGNGPASLERARQLRDAGKPEQALLEYQNVVRSDPNVVEAYAEAAEILLVGGQREDFARAAEWCEQGLKVVADNERLHLRAAEGWLAAKAFERAMPHLQWLMERCPDCPFPHAGLAVVLAQNDRLDEAQRQAEMAIRLAEGAPEGHLALGLVLLKKGQPQQAREQFKIVMESEAPPWIKDQVPK